MAGVVAQRGLSQRAMNIIGGATGAATQGELSAQQINSFRVIAVVERLSQHFRTGNRPDPTEFYTLCLSLARGIDYAIANNDIPPRAQELPALLKQVYHRKNDLQTQAAVMVLMISVKNACKNRWFLVQDADELLAIADQLARSFCSPNNVNNEPSGLPLVRSDVIPRFFPRMKIGHVLASLGVKPGYNAFAVDFHILRDKVSSPQEKIYLFVVQTDGISTSTCLISPPKVNFLLNGKGVERRIDISMDNGPQLPTNVTPMLKYGTNLLQAVGQFNGNYVIAVAFASILTVSNVPALQDYVQPVAAELESDSEIIEGAARISLNCPISFSRIKTPVKGQLCKHHQCFDFENYIDINSRRPSWRCPHCNQSVCYLDIRIDQNMVKVLREVGGNVSDIILSADGSWKAIMDRDTQTEEHRDRTLGDNRDESMQCESTRSPSTLANVVDLTLEDSEENYAVHTYEFEDRKPFKDVDPGNSADELHMSSVIHHATEITQNIDSRVEDDFFSGVYLPCSPSNGSASPGTSNSPATNSMVSPVLTEAVSPAYNRELTDMRWGSQARDSITQTHNFSSSNLQLHPAEVGNTFVFKDFGRSMPTLLSRAPIAVQALPAQSQVPASHNRSRTNLNPLLSNGSHTDALNNSAERQQQFSRSLSDTSSSSMMHYSMPQNQGSPYIQSPLPQVVGLPAATQGPSSHRGSMLPPERHNPHYSSSMGVSTPPHTSQPSTMHTSTRFNPIPTGYRSSRVPRTPPVQPVQLQAPRSGSSFSMTTDGLRTSAGDQRGPSMGPVSRADVVSEIPSEQDWRPTGRMRGSLQGRAYSAALNQFFIQPTQSSSAATPPPDTNMYTSGDV